MPLTALDFHFDAYNIAKSLACFLEEDQNKAKNWEKKLTKKIIYRKFYIFVQPLHLLWFLTFDERQDWFAF